MNYNENVAEEWKDAESRTSGDSFKMVLSRSLAKKLHKAIVEDLRTNRGEDILVRVYNVDDGLLHLWLGSRHYWKLPRSQVFRLKLRIEAFLSKKGNQRLVLTLNQVKYLQIQLMAVKKDVK